MTLAALALRRPVTTLAAAQSPQSYTVLLSPRQAAVACGEPEQAPAGDRRWRVGTVEVPFVPRQGNPVSLAPAFCGTLRAISADRVAQARGWIAEPSVLVLDTGWVVRYSSSDLVPRRHVFAVLELLGGGDVDGTCVRTHEQPPTAGASDAGRAVAPDRECRASSSRSVLGGRATAQRAGGDARWAASPSGLAHRP